MNSPTVSVGPSSLPLWRELLYRVLSVVISQHGKRLIFIASLYCYITRLDSLRDEALDKLNQAMSLARTGKALRLGAAVRNSVWSDVDIQSIIDENILHHDIPDVVATRISKQIVSRSPAWIRYRRTDDMVQDIKKLIDKSTMLTARAA